MWKRSAVAPEWQRRGYGTLATGSLGFYARPGWTQWRGPTAIRTEARLLPTPGEQPTIIRLARMPPLDLDSSLSAEWRTGELW